MTKIKFLKGTDLCKEEKFKSTF